MKKIILILATITLLIGGCKKDQIINAHARYLTSDSKESYWIICNNGVATPLLHNNVSFSGISTSVLYDITFDETTSSLQGYSISSKQSCN